MASKFKIGDLVWGKMKSFPAWPGKIIEPQEVAKIKIPADRKKKQLVFFFGSENHAWLTDECIFDFKTNKDRFTSSTRIPKGFPEALQAIEDACAKQPKKSQKVEEAEESGVKAGKTLPKRRPSSDSKKSKDNKPGAKRSEASEKKAAPQTIERERKRSLGTLPSPVPKKAARQVAKETSEDFEFETARTQSETKKRPSVAGGAAVPAKRGKTSTSSAKPEVNHRDSIPDTVEVKTLDLTNAVFRKPKEAVKASRLRDPMMSLNDFGEDVPPQDIIATPMKIGFLGLGIMGSSLVTNLLRSGHEVTVWNRTPAKCKEFVRDGALKCNTPSEVVAQCDITFSCVSDPSAIRDLVFGNSGVLQAIAPDKGFVDMSTIDTQTVEDIDEAVTSRGGRFLEAPMVTTRSSNERPVILASGEKKLFDDCFSCFAAMGKKALYLGECGCATKMKLALSLLSGTMMAGLAESLALVEKVGLDGGDLSTIVQMTNMNCPLFSSLADDMLQSKYSSAHTKLQSMQKDLRLVVNLSDAVEQPMHVGAAVNEVFKKAKAKGYGEHDVAAVYRAADL